MPYRKVTAIEQICYMLKWGLKNGFQWNWRNEHENDPDHSGRAAAGAGDLEADRRRDKARRRP